MGELRNRKTCILTKFHRTDLVICSHSREGKTPSYSRINTLPIHMNNVTCHYFSANDVAATSENSFYFTNYANFRDHYRHMMEILLMFPFGSVWYYDGKDYTMVADGFVLANGIMLSKDHQNVYAVTSLMSMLNIFKRETNNSLTLEQEFPLYFMPDNVNIEPSSGNLIIATSGVCHMMMDHLNNPEMPAPSKVFMINMKNGSYAESMIELFSDDSSGGIWGASVGYVYKNKMLIGTVLHRLMYCEVRTL